MRKLIGFVLTSCLVGLLLFPAGGWAGVADKKTVITINAPVKIPGHRTAVLAPGKYVIRVLDSLASRNIVQIFDEQENQLLATVLAIPNYRIQPAATSEFTFWETPAGEPVALRSWFYPGDNYGFEFAYPRSSAAQIAKSANKNILTVHTESEEAAQLKEAAVSTTTPQGAEVALSNEYTASAGQKWASASSGGGKNAKPQKSPQR
jgi:hypothetical protein